MLHKTLKIYRESFSGLSRDIWLLSLVTLVNRAGTMVLLFLSLYLTQELKLTLSQTGIAMSCFGFGSLAGTFLGGKLTDRYGYYQVMLYSLILHGLMFMVLIYIQTYLLFCLFIFITSTVGDAFRPAALASISAYSKPKNQTRAVGLVRLAINLGFAAAPTVGGLLAISVGYHALFVVDGVTCLAAAFLLFFFLNPKTTKSKPQLVPELSAADLEKPNSPYKDGFYLYFLFLKLLVATAFMQLFNTVPIYLREHFAMNEGEIGMLISMNGIIIVLVEMPLIFAVESRVHKLNLIGFGAALMALSYFMYLIPGVSFLLPIVAMVLITFGEIINFPFTNSFALDRATPQTRGQYMGLFAMIFSIANIIAPALGMYVAEHFGYFALWTLMGSFCLLAFLGFFDLKKRLTIS